MAQAGVPRDKRYRGSLTITTAFKVEGQSLDQVRRLFKESDGDGISIGPNLRSFAPVAPPSYRVAMKTPQCPCGSGLRPIRCCQLDLGTVGPPGSAEPLLSLVEQAIQAHGQGRVAEAEQLCHKVLELAPGQPGALVLLYRICKEAGRTRAADALLRRAVQLDPNNFWPTNELALALLSRGDVGEAEIHARNAVRIAPDNPQAHNLMGMVLTESNRPQVGEYHYRQVLALSKDRDPILVANLAWNLKNQGKMSEARQLYEEATRNGPDVLQTLVGWARMEEADRNFERAAELLDRAERASPDNLGVLLTRAVIYGRLHSYSQALAILDVIAARSEHGTLGPGELLEKGRLLDRLGRYDEAFAAFIEGKRQLRETTGISYRADEAQQLADRLKRFFTSARVASLPRGGVRADSAQPLFILGFPRSGTTLVEQTLSAHPRVRAGDELPFINDIVSAMPHALSSPAGYPEALAELWMGDRCDALDELRDAYLRRVRRIDILDAGAAWFTDKMPLNETHLGLIALMFPRSPLLHVLRHPLDVVLSVFSNHMTHGFYCAYDLESAARHFVLIMDLVEHYRGEMTLRYLPVRYESLVGDQEAQVRRMLDFIGEPFDERCLQFQENRRYARTASYAQVTEPLYDRSCYRYRHYLKHLESVVPILEPVINRLGYAVE